MKALSLRRPGSLQDFQPTEFDLPHPRPGWARIRIVAAGINPADYKLALSGVASWKYPHIPGLDGAGIVDALDPADAGALSIGTAVAFHGDLRLDGSFAEYCLVPLHALAAIPPGLSFLQAAALPCAGLTAWEALHGRAHVQAGQTVVVQGAAGGVGSFAVQLAKRAGARVIATCSPENNEYVKSLGADEIIDYNTQTVKDRVLELTEDFGAHVIIESVSSHSATLALQSLGYGGHLVCLSGLPDLSKLQAFSVAPSVHEIALGAAYSHGTTADQQSLASSLASLLDLVKQGDLKVYINRVVELEGVSQALVDLRDRHVRGKIVVQVGDLAGV